MDHFKQAPILKPSEGLGNEGLGQVREHPRKILIGHPDPITAGMEMTLSLPLLPIKVVELSVDGRRNKAQSIGQFKHGLRILHDQSSSMKELKRLRL